MKINYRCTYDYRNSQNDYGLTEPEKTQISGSVLEYIHGHGDLMKHCCARLLKAAKKSVEEKLQAASQAEDMADICEGEKKKNFEASEEGMGK